VYGDPSSESTYTPYQYNQSALSFLDATVPESPFFLYYSLGLAHSPFGPTPDDPAFTGTDTEYFWEMMKYADGLVGNILDKIDSLGVEGNTIVIFAGDNGTDDDITSSFQGSAMIGGKATTDEKGVRVPFYIRWPGVITPSTTYDAIAQFEDIAPTVTEMCGLAMPQDRIIDGRSFLGAILGQSNAYIRTESFTAGSFGAPDNAVNSDYKATKLAGFLSITNWPYGDDVISAPDQVDAINLIQLNHLTTNRNIVVFGDRYWGGSTNEFILREAP
jgi:arylsulfatase A-like enzyme